MHGEITLYRIDCSCLFFPGTTENQHFTGALFFTAVDDAEARKKTEEFSDFCKKFYEGIPSLRVGGIGLFRVIQPYREMKVEMVVPKKG